MAPYDWVLVALGVALAIRGWLRGFFREVVDVVVLVVGLAVVFRLARPFGVMLSAMANIPYEAGRIGAAMVLLILVVIGASILGRVITTTLHIVPGVSVLDRIGGALVGVIYAGVIAVFATTMLGVVPLPSSVRTFTDDALDASVAAEVIMDPDGSVQAVIGTVSGETLVGSVLAVREAVGDRLAAGTIPIPLPQVAPADVSVDPEAARLVGVRLDAARIEVGENPLAVSDALSDVAVSRARRAYLSGRLGLDDRLAADLAASGIPGSFHTDLIVLGASPDGVAEAMLSTARYRDAVISGAYTRIGIAVLDGPVGLIAVAVMTP